MTVQALPSYSCEPAPPRPFRVTKVHSRIGFSCCKASEKWKPIVSHFQEQFGRDSSLLAMRQQPSGPNSSHPFREREEDILSASMPASSTSTETRKARSQTYMRVPSPAQTRRAELATEESVRKVCVNKTLQDCLM